jgi:hypothetical protein
MVVQSQQMMRTLAIQAQQTARMMQPRDLHTQQMIQTLANQAQQMVQSLEIQIHQLRPMMQPKAALAAQTTQPQATAAAAKPIMMQSNAASVVQTTQPQATAAAAKPIMMQPKVALAAQTTQPTKNPNFTLTGKTGERVSQSSGSMQPDARTQEKGVTTIKAPQPQPEWPDDVRRQYNRAVDEAIAAACASIHSMVEVARQRAVTTADMVTANKRKAEETATGTTKIARQSEVDLTDVNIATKKENAALGR